MKAEPKFNIGDRVYHVIPESAQGVVKNIQYFYAEQLLMYQVAFDEKEESLWYFEHELSTSKHF